MNRFVLNIAVVAVIVLSYSCRKTDLGEKEFETYLIPAGQQRSTCKIKLLTKKELKFIVKFDSSAIYTSLEPENQWASNKILGFSDCNTGHQENSARFGWRWLNNSLEILAYCYVDSQRTMEYLTTIEINKEYEGSLKITEENYLFFINGASASLKRGCSQSPVKYYLYPFFGGQETAPHDIRIKIKHW